MKKRIVTLLLALVMVVSLVAGAIPALAAEEGITLRLHYHREDGNYEGWNMWFWDPDGTSTLAPPYYFTEEENGDMVSTITLKTGTMRVGFIVRLNEWEAKDIGEDQFIDIAGILGGTLDYYVESGVKGGRLEKGSDVKEGVVITGARYAKNSDGIPQVIAKMSDELDYTPDTNTFTVKNNDGAVEITAVKKVSQYYYLTLAEELDPTRGYSVSFEGNDYAVQMPDYFSSAEFENEFTYEGDDLGATYTKDNTKLRVWAPTAVDVSVLLYTNGDKVAQAEPVNEVAMTKDVNGTWIATLEGDMNGTYYTYRVTTDNAVNEACDPYARTTGVNGDRAMIIDLDATDPEGWANDKDPHYNNKFTDNVIYELHVRDFSIDDSSGITNKGKYLGLIETGTTYNGVPTGLDHIKNLGVTHVQLLPVYDYSSVDESKLDTPQFNWGYDPKNYNVPEGSYSSDPFNGAVRVEEFKEMVKGLHDNGLSVIMDVVYNHVSDANGFCFNKIVPGYFSRPNSNGSGCGNDTASERAMVSKYIVDSVNYWVDEYHIDGFRFDLVGLIDTDTINTIVETVHKDHPNVTFHGEGWTMSTTPTKTGVTMATQVNSAKTPEFAYFSDTIRNAVKGGTYGGVSKGFISGAASNTNELFECFKGMPSWCKTPSQSINYISCHDNNTLYDHITMVTPDATEAERIAMNKMGAAFVITSQGIPFFLAGEEFLRSKPNGDGTFNENSYNAKDEVNAMKWSDLTKAEYKATSDYYKGLIAFRKAHPALRLTNAADVNANVTALQGTAANVVAYQINGGVNGEKAEAIIMAFNANKTESKITLPAGEWNICINGETAGTASLSKVSGEVTIPALSTVALVKGEVDEPATPGATQPGGTTEEPEDSNLGLIIGIVAAVVIVAAAVVVFIILKKKK